MPAQQFPIGRRIDLPGHFAEPVVLESVRVLGDGFECRVRLSNGMPDEAILSPNEAATIFGRQAEAPTSLKPVDAESLRLLVESSRIRLAYTHDRHFAVSLSGIRTLPHQIEAVYLRMLPQPRLRYLLADDPGAGKTIMAGLLIKEMRLREAIDRVLILCPAALTIQWQDELLRWFGESFDIIFSAVDQQQLINPWHRTSQVIASLDYAKQDDVRERVWSERWDLVIIDEAHKCSAYTKSSSGRGDETEKTKRYQIAEKLAAESDAVDVVEFAGVPVADEDELTDFEAWTAGQVRRMVGKAAAASGQPFARFLAAKIAEADTVAIRLTWLQFDAEKRAEAGITSGLFPMPSEQKSLAASRDHLERSLRRALAEFRALRAE